MSESNGLRALAVALPDCIRTNDFWRERYPEAVARHEERTLGRLFATSQPAGTNAEPFDVEMTPYLRDPFRGTVERRVLGTGESALDLETRAAGRALAAAGMSARDVDLVLVTSFPPDQPGVGNAAFLVKRLGLRCPAWNLESTCSSALVALETAAALIGAGRHRHVLVVTSCTYSRVSDLSDSLSWFLGDGAGAYLVGPVASGLGLLSLEMVPTAETCGTFYHALETDPAAGPVMRIRCAPETQRILRETATAYLNESVGKALRRAGATLGDVAFFVFNTPTAWFAAFCARSLGIDPQRTLSTYPRYANIGPALMPVNLYEAAVTGRIRPGDLVVVFTIGSVSTAGAAVMRWGEVALGAASAMPAAAGGAP